MKPIKYKCKENDNMIQFHPDDDGVDGEFWFADELGKSWVVIGSKDMARMLKKMGFRLLSRSVVG